MIEGRATREHTEELSTNFPMLAFQALGSTGLQVSQAGFGCYRVWEGEAHHEQALDAALKGGVNLIDTSSNYGDGSSEQLVGNVLGRLISRDALQREQVVIVSKGGYLQGQNYQLSQVRKEEGRPFQDLVCYDEGLEHCIHPEFLADQIGRSLARLNCQTIDVYLLHNPEYYLMWAAEQGHDPIQAQAEFYRRIAAAFAHLEKEVALGRIGFYGISSNTFPVGSDQKGFCDLSRVWALSDANIHFRVIQYPMNLIERGAAVNKNQDAEQTLLRFCANHRIGTLVNRPLNAILGGRLLRLAEVGTFLAPNHPQYEAMKQNQQIIRQFLGEADRDWSAEGANLGQLALRALRTTLGNDCVLVGMRQGDYVADVLAELKRPVPRAEREGSWARLNLS